MLEYIMSPTVVSLGQVDKLLQSDAEREEEKTEGQPMMMGNFLNVYLC